MKIFRAMFVTVAAAMLITASISPALAMEAVTTDAGVSADASGNASGDAGVQGAMKKPGQGMKMPGKKMDAMPNMQAPGMQKQGMKQEVKKVIQKKVKKEVKKKVIKKKVMKKKKMPGQQGAQVTPPPQAQGTPPSATHNLEIKEFAFSNTQLTVKVGDTVTWINKDDVEHSVVADGGAFESALLAKDATFNKKFDTAGTFAYHCGPHPSMTATVVVTE